jgi:hypothetical protein
MLALLLPLLANCWSALLAFLARIPWHVYLVAGLFLWGLHWQHTADHAAALVAKQSTALAAAQTAAKASEQARQHEQQLTVKVRLPKRSVTLLLVTLLAGCATSQPQSVPVAPVQLPLPPASVMKDPPQQSFVTRLETTLSTSRPTLKQ